MCYVCFFVKRLHGILRQDTAMAYTVHASLEALCEVFLVTS
jgi:hypothetical protein